MRFILIFSGDRPSPEKGSGRSGKIWRDLGQGSKRFQPKPKGIYISAKSTRIGLIIISPHYWSLLVVKQWHIFLAIASSESCDRAKKRLDSTTSLLINIYGLKPFLLAIWTWKYSILKFWPQKDIWCYLPALL